MTFEEWYSANAEMVLEQAQQDEHALKYWLALAWMEGAADAIEDLDIC